jgi:formylglycine-generating enzyme
MHRLLYASALLLAQSCAREDAAELPTTEPFVELNPATSPLLEQVASAPPALSSASSSAHGPASSCSPDMLEVAWRPPLADKGRFCVDHFEAQLVELRGDARVPHPPSARPRAGVRYAAVNRPGVLPQAYVSRTEASAACEASGKRLCTRSEWMTACRGAAGTPFPYGARYEDGRCNLGKRHLLTLLFPDRVYNLRYEDFNDPSLHARDGFLAPTGAYDGCASSTVDAPKDMVGNLHEWVADDATRTVLASILAEVPRQWQPTAAGNGIFMGGFYSTRHEHGPGCLFTTVAHEPAYHDYSIGFRCCRSAER